MSKNCNGANIVHGEYTESPADAASSGISGYVSERTLFPPQTGFKGFIPTPHVLLERFDITAYLERHKRPVTRRKIRKDSEEDDALHWKRLSQKCLVKLTRDDLDKLKASFQGRPESPTSSTSHNSDSESCNSTDMTVKCHICEKSYNSEKKLLKHQQKKHIIYKTAKAKTPKRVSFSDHVIVHEVTEYHKCRKCTKIFEDYQLLKSHMRRWHKKRNCYICNYCSRSFVDRMFFKVHIRLHCDICGQLLPNKSAYLKHRRDICRVYKLHKCKACQESFFKIMDLKDHGYEHIGSCYVCDICKDQFQSKCAIAHHFSFLHSRKRPKDLYVMRKMGTERLYLCRFCDESSVEREVVEHHVQKLPDLTNKATTGYKDYYFCDQCMRKFDTETDMLQHKWTHFLNTSDNSQTRPKSILTKHKEIKTTYNINEELPEFMQPFVVLEKVDDIYPMKFMGFVDVSSYSTAADTIHINMLKKAIVDPKSKKTIVSKHQCGTCGKYFSTNYCLNRHIATQHEDFDSLRCRVCEETFVWPSLLKSHKCIRLNHPEMPFDDARAEIHFDNQYTQNGFDDLCIEEDDYMNAIDFEIPAPVVELRECDSTFMGNGVVDNYVSVPDKNGVTSSGLRLVMQEVPIEF